MKIDLTFEQINWLREAISDSHELNLQHRPHNTKQIVQQMERIQESIQDSTADDGYCPHEYTLDAKFSVLANIVDEIDRQLLKKYDEEINEGSHRVSSVPGGYLVIDDFKIWQKKEANRQHDILKGLPAGSNRPGLG